MFTKMMPVSSTDYHTQSAYKNIDNIIMQYEGDNVKFMSKEPVQKDGKQSMKNLVWQIKYIKESFRVVKTMIDANNADWHVE